MSVAVAETLLDLAQRGERLAIERVLGGGLLVTVEVEGQRLAVDLDDGAGSVLVEALNRWADHTGDRADALEDARETIDERDAELERARARLAAVEGKREGLRDRLAETIATLRDLADTAERVIEP